MKSMTAMFNLQQRDTIMVLNQAELKAKGDQGTSLTV